MTLFDQAYAERQLLFGREMTPELSHVIDLYNISGQALDLGCGDGRDTYHVLTKGIIIDAVDFSKVAIDHLLKRKDIQPFLPNMLNATVADLQDLRFEIGKYNFIYGVTIIDHIPFSAHSKIIDNIMLSLKPNGYLFLKVHTVDDDGYLRKQGASEFSNQIQHYFGRNELLRIFIDKGLILFYQEASEEDHDHGSPHTHAFASILLKLNKKGE